MLKSFLSNHFIFLLVPCTSFMSPLLTSYFVDFQEADAVRLICVVVCVDIYCCGLLSTRKSDCTGLPVSMLRNPEGSQQRGQSHIKMKGNMSLISWYNKGNFRFLSNAYSPIKQGIASGSDTSISYRERTELKALKLVIGCLRVQITGFFFLPESHT